MKVYGESSVPEGRESENDWLLTFRGRIGRETQCLQADELDDGIVLMLMGH